MSRPYQDVYRDGRVIEKGRRECAHRYKVIRDLIRAECVHGPTVADIGGWDGYFTRRLRDDLGADAVNIDTRPGATMRMKVTKRTVSQIGYKDAILALSVLHHMGDWEPVLEALVRSCGILVVEVNHPDEAKVDTPVMRLTRDRFEGIYNAVRHGELICETPALDPPHHKRPMFVLRNQTIGTVESGKGRAAVGIQDTDPTDWWELGYEPFPGTLNICVTAGARAWLESLEGVTAPGLDRSTHYVPVTVNGSRGHVHFARNPKGRTVVEIVAPANLRKTLNLQDGDRVVIKHE